MESYQHWIDKVEDKEELTAEELEEFASIFIAYHKFTEANVVLGENVETVFNLSKIVNAYMPKVTQNYLGVPMSLKELKATYPFNERILENEMLEFENGISALAQRVNVTEMIENPAKVYKELNLLTEEFGIDLFVDKRTKDMEKALKNARLNYNQLMKNQKVLQNHKFYKIVNKNHRDADICDNFIGNIYNEDDLVRPPYHPNCRCDIKGLSKEEYNGLTK